MMQMIGDHLWQSTLFAIAAALLAAALRANRAQVRYWVWLAASAKFLVPFAGLVALGRRFGWRTMAASTLDAGSQPVAVLVGAVSQPFSAPGAALGAASPAAPPPALIAALPGLLAAAWIAGSIAMVAIWYVRWRRVASVIRSTSPLDDRRVRAAIDARGARFSPRSPCRALRAVCSDTSLEPGVFGILRPVLIWPRGIAGRLSDDQIDAIVAHELSHVARRDNLTAALHMAVQALLWFHPLVWWIGGRLVDERERACDEAVVEHGSEPHVYAEGILRTCEFCVEAPAVCMGVTGSDLRKRIEDIMTGRAASALSVWRRGLLAGALAGALLGPIAVGLLTPALAAQTQAPSSPSEPLPSFEVASVKPGAPGSTQSRIQFAGNGRLTATNVPLRGLIRLAYDVFPFQLVGGPDWIDSQRFDVTAKAEGTPGAPTMRLMLRSLLVERFNISVRSEKREMPIFALVLARSDGRLGPKLRPAGPECAPIATPAGLPGPAPPPGGRGVERMAVGRGGPGPDPNGPSCPSLIGPGFISTRSGTMAQLARALSGQVQRVVVDRTALTGLYDADIEFAREPGPGGFGPDAVPPPPDAPAIFTALQEQLGLKLEGDRAPVDVVVIERVDPLIPD